MFSTGGLAQRILDQNIVEDNELLQIVQQAKDKQHSLIDKLFDAELIDPAILAQLVAEEFGLPVLDLKSMNKALLPIDLIDISLVEKYHAIPLFQRGHTLYLAMTDPTNQAAIDDFKFNTGLKVDTVVADKRQMLKLMEYIDSQINDVDSLLVGDDTIAELIGSDIDDAYDSDELDATDENDGPIVKFVHKVLMDAIRTGASDIHFEPYEKSYRVRYRTDGILEEVSNPPIKLGTRIASRLKIISSMDISERRLPQDGRIKLKISKSQAIDFRVNTLPTLWGEKIVLRILDASAAQLGIDALGYTDSQKQLYLDALDQPQGMILVTGPTGSGKTVSLYTGLNILNISERNISTAEDPVEINLEGINQVQINNKINFTFSDALRAFLRQDPDVIMVGEIRDLTTAEIAIKAAQTGHLVLSTLHTNSAADTINRLMNMGVAPFNLATSVSLIIAQRLARRLCQACAEPADIPRSTLLKEGFLEHELDGLVLKKAVGCDICGNGYKGRTGIFEVVKITPALESMIMEGKNAIELAEQIDKEGFNSLRRSALDKAKAGEVSLMEVNRVTAD
ncbi:MAG: type IV-A pilus assembly ATPase PilB [Pseudomonadota bacterium]